MLRTDAVHWVLCLSLALLSTGCFQAVTSPSKPTAPAARPAQTLRNWWQHATGEPPPTAATRPQPAATPSSPEQPAFNPNLIQPTSASEPAQATAEVVQSPPSPSPNQRLQRVLAQAQAAYAPIDSYIARLRRREVVNGKQRPEEVLLFKLRKKPLCVHLQWLSDEGKGREVLYFQGRYEDKLQILTAVGDIPLMPAGRRLSLSPDSPMVRNASRHHITEAGLGTTVELFVRLLEAQQRGGSQILSALGSQRRPEFPEPMEAVRQTIPAGSESTLPNGGTRTVYFDPQTHLPGIIQTVDAAGKEVEYYCFDRLQLGVRLDDLDFDIDHLWKPRP